MTTSRFDWVASIPRSAANVSSSARGFDMQRILLAVLSVEPVDVIDNQELHRTLNRFQLQAELFLQRGNQRWRIGIIRERFLSRKSLLWRHEYQLKLPATRQ